MIFYLLFAIYVILLVCHLFDSHPPYWLLMVAIFVIVLLVPFSDYEDYDRVIIEISSPEAGNLKYLTVSPLLYILNRITNSADWSLRLIQAFALLVPFGLASRKHSSIITSFYIPFLLAFVVPVYLLHWRQGLSTSIAMYSYLIIFRLVGNEFGNSTTQNKLSVVILVLLAASVHPIVLTGYFTLFFAYILQFFLGKFKHFRFTTTFRLNSRFYIPIVLFVSFLVVLPLIYSVILSLIPTYSVYSYWVDKEPFSFLAFSGRLYLFIAMFAMSTYISSIKFKHLFILLLTTSIVPLCFYGMEMVTGLRATARLSSGTYPLILAILCHYSYFFDKFRNSAITSTSYLLPFTSLTKYL